MIIKCTVKVTENEKFTLNGDNMKIKGILTNCVTNKESTIELEYEINENDRHELIFQLIGGSIDYELFYIDEYVEENMLKFGWLACIGTEGRWDRLFIPAEEMKKAFDEINKVPKSTLILERQQELKNLKDQRKAKKNDLYHLDIKIEKIEREVLSEISYNKENK